MSQNVLEGLNPKQREAVSHTLGPLLIVAGAGTGKTTVITRRIACLISTKKAKPEEIIALTFTDKGAIEMEERVDLLVPYGYTDIWISTFHSFGDKILRENALEMGLSDDFKVLTQPEQVIFFKENLFRMPLEYYRPAGNPTRFIQAMLGLFSRAKDEDVGPEDYRAYADGLKNQRPRDMNSGEFKEFYAQQKEIARCYDAYQRLKLKHGRVDFGDQVYLALRLLRSHPLVLKRYQEKFKYILVDEFQDTNYAQFQLVKLLAQGLSNITVVGDDDQSIYKFRGAAISNILNFIDTYPAARQIILTENYRSTQVILDCAYKLVRHNNPDRLEVKSNIDKRLTGRGGKAESVKFLRFDDVSTEADAVAQVISEKISRQYALSDFAILVRSNNDADPFLRALNLKNIPWRFSGNQGLYSREEIRVLISFLRSVAGPENSISLYYLLSSEFYGLEMADLNRILNYAARKNRPLYAVLKQLRRLNDLPEIGAGTLDLAEKAMADLDKHIESSRQFSAGVVLYNFLKETGYLKKLSAVSAPGDEEKAQNIAKFFNLIHKFETAAKEDKVAQFISHLDLLLEAGDDPATVEADLDVEAVNVLTVHKAKGLEFKVVFMVSLVMGKFPWPRRKDAIELPEELVRDILPKGEFHIQEERRLFYVGMTRAKDELYFTASMDYGGERTRKVSQFILEALDLPAAQDKPRRTKALETIERFAPPAAAVQSEKEEIAAEKILTLSYFQIDDYLTCPLKYRYVHLLKIPILPHHSVIYGKTLHDSVQYYYQKKMTGQGCSRKELLNAYSASWQSEGFLTREHEEERFNNGLAALTKFFNAEEKKKKAPAYVEREFSFFIENNRIIGRWDRVDICGKRATIFDFKGSAVRKMQDALRRTRESLQLAIYALAFENQFGYLPEYVALYFLESGLIGRIKAAQLDLEKTREQIRRAALGIRQRLFIATPKYLACQYCAYFDICPHTAQKR